MRPVARVLGCAVAGAVLLSGCALPLPKDVHEVGVVGEQQRAQEPLQVIPPGPKPGADATDTVLGFLGAQASSESRHAVARQFLTDRERNRWQDQAQVLVYDPDRLQVVLLNDLGPDLRADQHVGPRPDPNAPAVVRVTSHVTGRVRGDGSYSVQAAEVREDYTLVRVRGEWRLDHVPDGLRLAAADRERAYAPYPVYYLTPGALGAPRRVVPDQVFLPVGEDLARGLLTRLLQPPSAALRGSVATAVPAGARLARPPTQSASGVVTVDLIGTSARPSGQLAQDLSAQLVWTLRSLGAAFRGLRLRLDGRVLAVPGEDDVQDPDDWDAYDPQGLGPNPPYYFVVNRRLRASVTLPGGPATSGAVGDAGAVPVDAVAVTPDRSRVALLEDRPGDSTLVRVVQLGASSLPVAATGAGLRSPSWGSGDRGLWLVSGARRVVRVDRGLHEVPVQGLPPGRVDALSVSRDGVRVALVVAGRPYVGRVVAGAAGVRITGLTVVLPALHAVRAVAWSSSAELTVLGVLTRSVQVVEVSVDGSSVEALNSAGLDPVGLTACPAGIVLVAGGRLYASTGGAFRQVQRERSSAPAFPG